MRRHLATLAAAVFANGPAVATDLILGEASTFQSPNGIEERCVRLARVPDGVYSDADLKAEAELCAIDFYRPAVALCPKTWSTSPGMIVYDIAEGPYAGDRAGFERTACPEGKEAKEQAKDDLAKFKPTMNARGTSGTFSVSPLLYYHFAAYFGAEIGVPAAVWRSMDRKVHLGEVARQGLAISGHAHSSEMNHNGWRVLSEADEDPSTYNPTAELFTRDEMAIFGVMLNSAGSRYNSEVNGSRASGWGKGQSEDFQRTAPFLALRSEKPLAQAVVEGIQEATRDPQILKDMGPGVDPRQVAFWMEDIANIVLLDFIFSQQDRIGNIDYVVHWFWVENGELKQAPGKSHGNEPPPAPGAVRIKRTHLNDNDAGARVEYANYAKSTEMLQKLRHFPAGTYRKLMALNADFDAQGPLYVYLRNSFGMDDRQVAQIVQNTALAAAILAETCQSGTLRFDLDASAYFVSASTDDESVDCVR